jgi:hydroxyacylglutathione hydrolase
MTRIWPLPCEGLGNSSYLAEAAEGLALAVDPGRDPRPYLGLAAGGEDLDLGGLTLRALATPGHTPEHLSYLLLDGAQPVAVFTGGALIVGGVARTDLADPARTEEWTRAAYRSARTLLALPGGLAAYPTHGPGSFCSAGETGEYATTIGRERAGSPLLAGAGEDAFTRRVLDRLGSYPAYFRPDARGEPARRGAARHQPPGPGGPDRRARGRAVRRRGDDRGRPPDRRFAACHIPGSLSDELRPAFATWLGWLASPDRPLVVVLDPGQDRGELVEAALLVGYDNLTGELDGGMDAWQAAGLSTASIPFVDPATGHVPSGSRVLDVRQHGEWASGHLPGAVHAELGTLAGPVAAAGLGDGPLAVMCGHGERAMTGASLLAAGPGGAAAVSVLRGGPGDWANATGQALGQE